MTAEASGTEGYAAAAPLLIERYESLAFADVHREVLHLLPSTPARVLDIGAGSGRDAAALAARGYQVLAVEPTAALRHAGIARHRDPGIDWLDDSLPQLARLGARGEAGFDLIMLTAVWMHLDAAQRRLGLPRIAGLLRPGAVMILSLRHGPVPQGRRMFEVDVDELLQQAAALGLEAVLRLRRGSMFADQPEVQWTRLALRAARSAAV